MLRFFASVVICCIANQAHARTIYPEWMSTFDMAQQRCQSDKPDERACKTRDIYFRKLRDAGYNFAIDKDNPQGYVWK